MDTHTKEKIASWFFRFPSLCMLVRTLLYSVWFQLCFLGLLLLPLLLMLVLAKIWRTTPKGFLPVVRISGVDWLQAKSLQRTGRKELEKGKIREGILSYSMAVADNPGNVQVVRQFLRGVLDHVDPPQFQGPALARAFWLLRLTSTNLADLELSGDVFEKFGLNEYLAGLLSSRESVLTSPLQKIYLRVLFNNGRVADFDRFWKNHCHEAALADDPELQLYRSAFEAGWGTPTEAVRAGARLKEKFNDANLRVAARQLDLLVCERRNDVPDFLDGLECLRESKKDRLVDHVRAWRLLASNDRRDEAVSNARAFAQSPATALETIQLAQAYFALGLGDSAKKLLDRFTVEFSFLDTLWLLYGNLLMESGQWDKLRQLALNIRLNPDVRERLSDLSYYFEGRAELAQDRAIAAGKAFSKIGLTAPENPQLAVSIAEGLQQLGYAQQARTLLASAETPNERNAAYWNLLAGVAYSLKDADLLLRATKRALELDGENRIARNNYAAALVTAGREPQEAIKETFQLMNDFPELSAIRINHALALIQNDRFDEADRLLAAMNPNRLSESERAIYQLACFETLVRQRRFELARKFLVEIHPERLFPVQRERLDVLKQSLPKAN